MRPSRLEHLANMVMSQEEGDADGTLLGPISQSDMMGFEIAPSELFNLLRVKTG